MSVGILRSAIAWVLGCVTIAGAAQAIVIRHDTDDSKYRAEEDRFAALGSIYRLANGQRDCVTTLVDPRWVVTAAHCTEDIALEDGHDIEFADGRSVRIRTIIAFPEEAGVERTPDIALIELAEPIAGIDPMPLYRDGDELGRPMLIPGWGGNGNGLEGLAEQPDGAFRVAENRVDAARDGFLIFRFDDPRSGLQTALALEGISGPGDSGNPALVSTPAGTFIAGIGSAQRTFGRGEGFYNAEEYYIRVSDYADWIAEVVANSADAED